MNGSERIEYIIQHFEGGSASAFAKRIGKSKSAVSKLRAGTYGFSYYADKIARAYPLINCRWLLTGEGDPVAREATEGEILERLERIEKKVEVLSSGKDKATNMATSRKKVPKPVPKDAL